MIVMTLDVGAFYLARELRLSSMVQADTAAFPLSPLPGAAVFLLAARLLKDKGVREYVHAAKIVRQTYPNATLDIVGPMDAIQKGLVKRS